MSAFSRPWAILVVFNIGIAWFLSRRWAASIKQLAAFVERIGKGDLEPFLLAGRGDEIGQLTPKFQQMVEVLSRSRLEIEQKTAAMEQQARALLTLHRVSATASRSLRQEEILEVAADALSVRPNHTVGLQ